MVREGIDTTARTRGTVVVRVAEAGGRVVVEGVGQQLLEVVADLLLVLNLVRGLGLHAQETPLDRGRTTTVTICHW